MNSSNDVDYVLSCLDSIRRAGETYITNCFLTPAILRRKIESGQLVVLKSGDVFVAQEKEAAHQRLYFAASGLDSLCAALIDIVKNAAGVLCCNVTANERQIPPLLEVFLRARFSRHYPLVRLTRLPREVPATQGITTNSPVTLRVAAVEDAEVIIRMLAEAFDSFSEPTPVIEEVVNAATAGDILLATEGQTLQGLLWTERRGQVATVRFWAVIPSATGKGVASALMRNLLEEAPKRLTRLWVLEKNENAIARYRHYGFQPDSIRTEVMTFSPNT